MMPASGGGYAVGIDLGTSNTVAVIRSPDGRCRPVLFDGAPVMPSAVYVDPSGPLVVGRDAQRMAMLDPARFEPNPKRRIDEPTVLLGDRELATVDLLAAVLRAVAHAAGEVCRFLPPAVLTFPASWGPARRQVLQDAAVVAGWPEVRLVPEPIAAAQYFIQVLKHPVPPGSSLAIFDFGGGTVDIAVVRNEGSGFNVLGSGGLEDLGGLDLDAALIAHLGEVLGRTAPEVWARLQRPVSGQDRRDRRLFWEDVRGAKEMLSRNTQAPLPVPGVESPLHVTREELEQVIGPLLRLACAETAAVVRRCGIEPRQLAGVLLVGGSSRIPLVPRLLYRELGVAATVLEQPELPVAEGAVVDWTRGAPEGRTPVPTPHPPTPRTPVPSPLPYPVSPGPSPVSPGPFGPVSPAAAYVPSSPAVPVSPAVPASPPAGYSPAVPVTPSAAPGEDGLPPAADPWAVSGPLRDPAAADWEGDPDATASVGAGTGGAWLPTAPTRRRRNRVMLMSGAAALAVLLASGTGWALTAGRGNRSGSGAGGGPHSSASPGASGSGPGIGDPFGGKPAGTWQRLPDLPVKIESPAVAAYKGKLWVAGGILNDQPRTKLTSVYIYDPAARTWSKGPDLPRPISHANLVVAWGNLYFLGGWVQDGGSDQVLRYDEGTRKWAVETPMPGKRVAGAAAFDGTRILFAGGTGDGGFASNDIWGYLGGVWTPVGKMKIGRQKLMAVGNGTNTVWIMGGHDQQLKQAFGFIEVVNEGKVEPLPDKEEIDPPIDSAAAIRMDSIGLCLIGGQSPGDKFNDWWCQQKGMAERLPKLVPQRAGLGVDRIGDTIYVVAGYGRTAEGQWFDGTNRFESYTPPSP
jgi:Ethanolamine utilization protein EutJ (predicted chaperonin)